MSQAKYLKYRPSGTTWFDKVPTHWQVSRLKTVATYRVSNVDKIPADDEEPVRLCNYTDVYYNEKVHPGLDLMCTTATVAEIRRFGLRVGDVVITKDSEDWRDIAVPALVTETAPDFVCGYHLAIIRPDPIPLHGPFLLRLLQATGINTQMQLASSGITRYSLPKGAIGEALIPLPPIEEQRAIADFLDGETMKVDQLVAHKQELIYLLQLRRSLLIAAATWGQNQRPSLDSAGWLPEVPLNWPMLKFKRLAFFQEGPGLRNWQFTDAGARVICVSNITEAGIDFGDYAKFIAEDEYKAQYRHFTVQSGDLLISSSGNSWGKIAEFENDEVPTILNTSTIRVNELPNRPLARAYIRWVLESLPVREQLRLAMTGACQPNFGPSHLGNVRLPVPPQEEQNTIATNLNRSAEVADELIGKVKACIEMLKGLKSSLISAAVTGQIDVRNYHPQEPTVVCQ
jgi:type I restriction enzyme S subunit